MKISSQHIKSAYNDWSNCKNLSVNKPEQEGNSSILWNITEEWFNRNVHIQNRVISKCIPKIYKALTITVTPLFIIKAPRWKIIFLELRPNSSRQGWQLTTVHVHFQGLWKVPGVAVQKVHVHGNLQIYNVLQAKFREVVSKNSDAAMKKKKKKVCLKFYYLARLQRDKKSRQDILFLKLTRKVTVVAQEPKSNVTHLTTKIKLEFIAHEPEDFT